MADYEKGKIIKGTVTGIEPYGAFVSLGEFYTGLIHISEISRGFVNDIHDFLNIGDNIYVEILSVNDEALQLNLSIKNIKYKINGQRRRQRIRETGRGFGILGEMLPVWIEEKTKSIKNNNISIDK